MLINFLHGKIKNQQKFRITSIIVLSFITAISFLIISIINPMSIKAGVNSLPNSNLEYIKSFVSDIFIDPNTADLTVTENITVNILHKQINHGIYRDFPLYYITQDTKDSYKVDFKILNVLLDNKVVSYHTASIKNGIRIYIGDPDSLISVGLHKYTIKYRVSREMRFFEDHSELYWNVNGNSWLFPILSIKAVVHLPTGVNVNDLRYKAYTGKYGDSGADYVVRAQNNNLIFETTRPFNKGEGLTIVISFPKGIVHEPALRTRIINYFKDNLGIVFLLVGIIASGLLLHKYWITSGKDPELGSIMPLFKPPKDMDPATLRFIANANYQYIDPKSISSMLVYLAVKGYLRIKEVGKNKFELELIKRPSIKDSVEYKLIKSLFPKDSKKTLALYEHSMVTARQLQRFKKEVEDHVKRFGTSVWSSNIMKTLNIALLSGILGLAALIIDVQNYIISEDNLVFFLWVLVIGLGFFVPIYINFLKKNFNKWPLYLFIELSILFLLLMILSPISYVQTVLLVVLIAINGLSLAILPSYTKKGIELKKQALGFREYLATAEQDRLNVLNPPELTVELFEKYLPYAMALGVAHKWAQKFTKVFRNLQDSKTTSGSISDLYWFSSYNNQLYLDNLTKTLDNTLNNVVTSAGNFNTSGGGSGFSGGFSGGGGGGGGGGGW